MQRNTAEKLLLMERSGPRSRTTEDEGEFLLPHLRLGKKEVLTVSKAQIASIAVTSESPTERAFAFLLASAMSYYHFRKKGPRRPKGDWVKGGREALKIIEGTDEFGGKILKTAPVTPGDVCDAIGISRGNWCRIAQELTESGRIRQKGQSKAHVRIYVYAKPFKFKHIAKKRQEKLSSPVMTISCNSPESNNLRIQFFQNTVKKNLHHEIAGVLDQVFSSLDDQQKIVITGDDNSAAENLLNVIVQDVKNRLIVILRDAPIFMYRNIDKRVSKYVGPRTSEERTNPPTNLPIQEPRRTQPRPQKNPKTDSPKYDPESGDPRLRPYYDAIPPKLFLKVHNVPTIDQMTRIADRMNGTPPYHLTEKITHRWRAITSIEVLVHFAGDCAAAHAAQPATPTPPPVASDPKMEAFERWCSDHGKSWETGGEFSRLMDEFESGLPQRKEPHHAEENL